MDPMIKSILDTDAYKLHMQQAVFHLYPTAHVAYEFQCRDSINDLGEVASTVQAQVDLMQNLSLTDDEYAYLLTKRYLKKDYLDWLRGYRFDPRQVTISVVPASSSGTEGSSAHGGLAVTIRGLWVETILWEVPLLALVSEAAHRERTPSIGVSEAVQYLNTKLEKLFTVYACGELDSFHVADFGTRRRYSFEVQEAIVKTLQSHPMFARNFFGTSNYYLAMKLRLPPVGTQAHEWFQAHQQLAPVLRDSQRLALTQWLVEYPMDLHIALTDCISMDSFLRDFDAELARTYVGLRHDSGDPYVWGAKAIEHYRRLNIDPKLKTLVFSDSLDLERAAKLHCAFANDSNVMCGIGTQLTCSIPGVRPLSIVIKMVECNGKPVAKISDAQGKAMSGDLEYIRLLGQTFNTKSTVTEVSMNEFMRGCALQVCGVPRDDGKGDAFLRYFFSRRFSNTAAALVDNIIYPAPELRNKFPFREAVGEERSDSFGTDTWVTVCFREREAVQIVLAAIVQRVTYDLDPSTGIKKLGGYVLSGADRLLVQGIVHPTIQDCHGRDMEVDRTPFALENDDSGRGQEPASTSCVPPHTRDLERATTDPTMCEDIDGEERVSGASHVEGNGTADVNWGSGCDRPHLHGRCPQSRKLELHKGHQHTTFRMRFVCLLGDCLSSPTQGQGQRCFVGISTHVVFKLLRNTSMPLNIVVSQPELTSRSGGVTGEERRWEVNVKVEVKDSEGAASVYNKFNNSLLDLMKTEGGTEEVEFRFLVLVMLDVPEAEQRLSIPLNTETELSVTPQNLMQMGGPFRCESHRIEPVAPEGCGGSAGTVRTSVETGPVSFTRDHTTNGFDGARDVWNRQRVYASARYSVYSDSVRDRSRRRGRSRSRSRDRSRRHTRRRMLSRSGNRVCGQDQHYSKVRNRSDNGGLDPAPTSSSHPPFVSISRRLAEDGVPIGSAAAPDQRWN